ncbi:arylamine N-acetyltransferase [Lysobacter sp. F6437]|uniref:arylamine N-acetyltransferase n=1 Tax=Lysobacter sp. F6437 TaxID=3459296 RepID=UPI00403E061C
MHDEIADMGTYLARLGFDSPPPPTLETLGQLQLRHTAAFPFETIATLLREPVPVDLPSVERKLLREGRGGYCFELNRVFLALLHQLGFQVRGLTGRVVMGQANDAMPARTHLLVRVAIDGVDYITDVGFGGMVPTAPLRLDSTDVQPTPHEPYRLARSGGSYILHAQVAGQWRALYRFDLHPQEEIDLVVGNWYVCTHPDSPFLGKLTVARTGPGLRRTLSNGSYAIHRLGASSERHELYCPDAVMTLLREAFGIRLPQRPGLRDAIAGVLEDASVIAG